MFERLVGLETEYALRFHQGRSAGRRESNAALCNRLFDRVACRVPLAVAIVERLGWFTANGGAVRFERLPVLEHLVPSIGSVEGATPECRGPRQLLLYQRAQDALLSQAAVNSAAPGSEVALLKSNLDSRGSPLGSHENYEATIASGLGLWLWRAGLVVLLPVVALLGDIAVTFALLLAAALYGPLLLFTRFLRMPRSPLDVWERLVEWLLFLSLLPLRIFDPLLFGMAFRRHRRQMLAFLITRPVIAGAGVVAPDGRFGLSPRAAAVRSVCSLAAESSRSVFMFGHVVKAALCVLLGDRWGYLRLFGPRQRLQITIGDSNMAQTAEYLKIGTTLLVLDAIEAGALKRAPRVRRPLRALRTICADPDLQATVRVGWFRRSTALQIQRYYWNACRRFVAASGRACPEAENVLRLWGETLDALEEDPSRLIGRLDWVTKRHLLQTAGRDAPLAAKRKIDLRYHELSREGYYLRLEAAGAAPTLVEPEEVLEAIQTPPPQTPAALRGRLIRRRTALRAGWHTVITPDGPIDLHPPDGTASPKHDRAPAPTHSPERGDRL